MGFNERVPGLKSLRHWYVAVIIALSVAMPRIGAAQQGAEIVRGLVRTENGEPLPGAKVTITGLQTFARRVTTTNAKGQYTALFSDAEGQYVVAVGAIGYGPVTQRARRMGESTLIVVDVTLSPAAVQLDSLTVNADSSLDPFSMGAGPTHDVLGGKLFSLDPSSVDALMAMVPGVAQIPGINGGPDRYSFFGTSPDQNSTLLDGSRYDGSAIPPGMLESAGVSTAPYNAAYGNFAGGQLAMRTRSGRDQFQGMLETRFAHPSLAWTDPRAGNPIAQSMSWSGNLSGPVRRGSMYYNFGFSHNTREQDFISLLSLNQLQREQSGLTLDTIAAVQRTLESLGIPVTTSGIPDQQASRNRSAMLRLDWTPSAATSLTFNGSAEDSRQLGTGISQRGFPSLSGSSDSRNMRAQLSASTYVGGFVDQLSTTFQSSIANSGPFLALPSGNVRVGAQYPGGTFGLTDVAFGGGRNGQSYRHNRSWSVNHELSRFSLDSRHRLAFGQSFEMTWSASREVAAPFGTFTYQSLQDLALNRPASYERTLSTIERSTRSMTSALWLQGESRVVPNRLQFEYGMRLDFNHPGAPPAYNPAVDSLFGRRTDRVPGAVGLSPRLGVTWVMSEPAANQFARTGPITLRGGVGAFRGVIPTQRIASLVDATGLPNSIRQLTCVGDATPTPDWGGLAADPAMPVECLDGAAPVEFATAVSNVQLFNPAYRPPTSWRGNLQLSNLTFGGWSVTVGGEYSYTFNNESAVDLNLRRDPAFLLGDEGNRPMYVPPSGIVPTTGAVAPGASRLTDRFGAVTDYRSDLASSGMNFTVRAQRNRYLFNLLPISLSYTYSDVRQQERGFGGTTAGDPFLRQWGRGQQPVHTFQAQTRFNIPFVALSLQLGLQSGRPYTPMVGGDVNGDGQANDQAFIVDPATASDPVLAQQMQDLLATATPSTRACLEAQLGRIAARNSCQTGWRLQPDVRFDLRLPGLSDPNMNQSALGQRLQLSVTTSNLLGTLLHLVGVSNTSLNVLSGANLPIDPTLLYVDGFDPETQRFRYRVNQQFGEGRPQRFRGSHSRYSGAFQVQLGARYHLGYFTPQRPMVEQLGLVAPDRELPPPTVEEVRERLRALTEGPVSMIKNLGDSLLLSDEQIARMDARHAAFMATTDSLLEPVVQYVVSKGHKAKDKQVRKLVGKVQQEMWPLMIETLKATVAELRPEQHERLPPMLKSLAEMPENAKGKTKKGWPFGR